MAARRRPRRLQHAQDHGRAGQRQGASTATTSTSPRWPARRSAVGGAPVDIVVGGVTEGTVSLNADGTLTFTPDAGLTGPASFTYTITDGTSQSAPATVSLTVDTPPVADADAYADAQGATLVLDGVAGSANAALTANDTDADGTTR